nr:hypothetical protein [Acidobacteriota bacterium]
MKDKTKNSFILVLDIGTSSVRAAVYDFKGNVLPETMVKNERRLTATDDGGAEIDAAEALTQVEKAIDEVLKKASKLDGEIEYAATSSFWHSLVGIDKNAVPTTKVFGWADTRSRKQVEILRTKLNENKTHNRTGARFHSSYWTAKLLWLRDSQPKVFQKTAKWLSLNDYISLKFFGRDATSVSMASGTGIFDIRGCVWDEELLNFLKIGKENLPEIVAEDAQTFCLNETYAKRWKKLKNTKW